MESHNPIWRPIIGYEPYYEVSSDGDIACFEKTVDYGRCIVTRPSKILKPRVGKCGYKYTIFSVDNVRKTVKKK